MVQAVIEDYIGDTQTHIGHEMDKKVEDETERQWRSNSEP